MTVRDWDLRNFGTGIKGLSGGMYTNMIVHNLSIKNTTNIAIFLTGHYVDCIVDSVQLILPDIQHSIINSVRIIFGDIILFQMLYSMFLEYL